MKRIITILAAAAVFATPAVAHASLRSPHRCGIGHGGYVTASWATSCDFAQNIARDWISGRCYKRTYCCGRVYSPVTRKVYMLFCQAHRHFPEHVYCGAAGTTAWIRFTYSGR
jgi:hypothetical protein